MEFLADTCELAAADVLVFVREAIQRFEHLRPLLITKLLDTFPNIKAVKYVISGNTYTVFHLYRTMKMCWILETFVNSCQPPEELIVWINCQNILEWN